MCTFLKIFIDVFTWQIPVHLIQGYKQYNTFILHLYTIFTHLEKSVVYYNDMNACVCCR